MRTFAFISAIYVMVLTAIPCIDIPQNHVLDKFEISQEKQDSHHHSDADHCSPFCTCNCCSTSVIIQEFHSGTECLVTEVAVYPDYHSSFFSDPSIFIWQPPKLS